MSLAAPALPAHGYRPLGLAGPAPSRFRVLRLSLAPSIADPTSHIDVRAHLDALHGKRLSRQSSQFFTISPRTHSSFPSPPSRSSLPPPPSRKSSDGSYQS